MTKVWRIFNGTKMNVGLMILLECGMDGVQMEILDNNCILCLLFHLSFAGLYWLLLARLPLSLPEQEMEIFHPVPWQPHSNSSEPTTWFIIFTTKLSLCTGRWKMLHRFQIILLATAENGNEGLFWISPSSPLCHGGTKRDNYLKMNKDNVFCVSLSCFFFNLFVDGKSPVMSRGRAGWHGNCQ